MDHRFSGFLRRLSIILFWIVLWQTAASLIRNHIFLVGPVDTLRALCEQIVLPDFWSAIAFSFWRISIGFFLAFFLGLFTGSLAYRLEMAEVFHIPFIRRALYIYRTALYPYLKSACRTALGMGFKSGIAAEVIGVPDGSIGEGLYLAKIYLSTAELFAWTVVIILVSSLFEKGFLWILKKCAGKGADVNESDK